MGRPKEWLTRIEQILRALEQGPDACGREQIEAIFGVSRAQAKRILVDAGAERRAGKVEIPLPRLYAWVRGRQAEAEQEKDRVAKVKERLAVARTELKARSIRIETHPADEWARLRELPVTFCDGVMSLRYDGTKEDLLRQTYRLMKAIQNDYDAFCALVESGGGIPKELVH